jgi:hypothetical protein
MSYKNNGEQNKAFLSLISPIQREQIINSIAKHYQTTNEAITDEIENEEAHHLCEYMIEPLRMETYRTMQDKRMSTPIHP